MEKKQITVNPDIVKQVADLFKKFLVVNNIDPTVAEVAFAYTLLITEKAYLKGMEKAYETCTEYETSSDKSTEPTKDSDHS